MAQTRKQLFIRADANSQMGTGHLMRCLALAQGWQDQGGSATFVTACDNDSLLKRFREEGFQVKKLKSSYPDPGDWQEFSQILSNHSACWVVLDGYHFDFNYQCMIKQSGANLLVVDDNAHLIQYNADIILNHNYHAADLSYSLYSKTCLLLGTNYLMLRREYWAWKDWRRNIKDEAKNILVSLGGSDPFNQTEKVFRALKNNRPNTFDTIIIVGAENPFFREINSKIEKLSGFRIKRNVINMPDLITWADLAISAGGTTSWEFAFLGLPNIVIATAVNQLMIAEEISNLKIADYLGWYEDVSRDLISKSILNLADNLIKRREMSANGHRLVDGNGIERIISEMSRIKK